MDNLLEQTENSNYIDSLKELKPTCSWLFPEKDVMMSFVQKNPSVESFETVMGSQVGCYLFARWSRDLVDEKRKKLHVLCRFLEVCGKVKTCDGSKAKEFLVKTVMTNYLSESSWEPDKQFEENGSRGIQWTAGVGDDKMVNNSHNNPLNLDLSSSVVSSVRAKADAAMSSEDIPGTIFEPVEGFIMAHLKSQVKC